MYFSCSFKWLLATYCKDTLMVKLCDDNKKTFSCHQWELPRPTRLLPILHHCRCHHVGVPAVTTWTPLDGTPGRSWMNRSFFRVTRGRPAFRITDEAAGCCPINLSLYIKQLIVCIEMRHLSFRCLSMNNRRWQHSFAVTNKQVNWFKRWIIICIFCSQPLIRWWSYKKYLEFHNVIRIVRWGETHTLCCCFQIVFLF